jgi:ankyrin repeat protein
MVAHVDNKLPLWTAHAMDSSIQSTAVAPHVPGWRNQFAKSDVLESLSLPRPNTTQPRQRRLTKVRDQLFASMPASPRLSTPYSPRAVTPATPRASTPASPRARAAAVPAPWATLDPWAAAPPRNPTVLLQQATSRPVSPREVATPGETSRAAQGPFYSTGTRSTFATLAALVLAGDLEAARRLAPRPPLSALRPHKAPTRGPRTGIAIGDSKDLRIEAESSEEILDRSSPIDGWKEEEATIDATASLPSFFVNDPVASSGSHEIPKLRWAQTDVPPPGAVPPRAHPPPPSVLRPVAPSSPSVRQRPRGSHLGASSQPLTEFERADTHLLDLCDKGELAQTSALLTSGQSVNVADEGGETPVHKAVRRGDEALLALLLAQPNVLPDEPDGLRHTPIALAIQLGHLGIAKKLIAHGVDLGRRSEPDGMTLLHKSCWSGHLEMTKLLLDTGRFAQLLETKDKAGRTPLHLASFRAPEQVCRMLIAAGANPIAKAAGANPMTQDARGSMPSKATGGLRADSAKLVGENDTYLKAVLLASKVNQQLDLSKATPSAAANGDKQAAAPAAVIPTSGFSLRGAIGEGSAPPPKAKRSQVFLTAPEPPAPAPPLAQAAPNAVRLLNESERAVALQARERAMLLERKERIDQTIGVPLTARYPPASTLIESIEHQGAAPHVSIRSTVGGPQMYAGPPPPLGAPPGLAVAPKAKSIGEVSLVERSRTDQSELEILRKSRELRASNVLLSDLDKVGRRDTKKPVRRMKSGVDETEAETAHPSIPLELDLPDLPDLPDLLDDLEFDEEEGEEEEGVEDLRELIPNPTPETSAPETSDAHLESAEDLLRQAQLLRLD